ncbi:MAG: histidinol dehydrogenase [Bacteroidales bacterium]|nr:histidinol dehydrogenase [Bacteroidales bacterium]
MNKIQNITKENLEALCERPKLQTASLEKIVNEIFEDVRLNGDAAVKKYSQKFDGLQPEGAIEIDAETWSAGADEVPEELKSAIRQAKGNIEAFHRVQIKGKVSVETEDGVLCWQESRAIQKVGLYIPGGTAPLFSTVLMLAVPAKLAGCEEIVLCTPPGKDGKIAAPILYAAQLAGVKRVMKVGGIQAIAALTYGTESIPKVYKIFGPGNQYVTAAKKKAFAEGTAIDLPAGPSEVLVLADESANPVFVAADLLSQAEHGTDSQVVCVSDSEPFLVKVQEEVEKQLAVLPRADIASESLKHARFLFSESKEETINFINEYAPEHFILASKDEAYYLENLKNAGSVFIGNYAPESAGDYLSGTNHTLPTNGFARSFGSLGLDDFTKKISFQRISREGLKNIGKSIELMARAEGLEAHAKAVELRMKNEK